MSESMEPTTTATTTLLTSYGQEIVTDTELDNSEGDEKLARHELTERIARAIKNPEEATAVKIVDVIVYETEMLFCLTPASFVHRADLEAAFENDVRYSVETRDITVDMASADSVLSQYISRLPVTRQTLAIRRKAFKRLPRAPLLTTTYRVVLTVFIGCVITLIYNILFT